MKTSGYWLLTAHNFTGFPEGKEPRWVRNEPFYCCSTEEMKRSYGNSPRPRTVLDVRTSVEDAKARAANLIPFSQMVSLEWVDQSSYFRPKLLGTLSRNKEWRWKPE
jgi:hypothetical protein